MAKMPKMPPDDLLAIQLGRRLSQLRLDGIQLLEGMCRREPALDLKSLPQEAEQNIRLGGAVRKADKRIDVKASFRIAIGKQAPDKSAIEVAATFMLHYRFTGDAKISQDDMASFCRRVGAAAAWPYWSEFVQTNLARMGLPPLTVPLLNSASLEVPNEPTVSRMKRSAKKKPAARRKSS